MSPTTDPYETLTNLVNQLDHTTEFDQLSKKDMREQRYLLQEIVKAAKSLRVSINEARLAKYGKKNV